MSVVSLDSPGAACTGANGFASFFLFGDAATTGLTAAAEADFLLEAGGVCNIEMTN